MQLDEYGQVGSIYTTLSLNCYLSPDTLDIGGGARAVTFDVLIDVAKDGCGNFGFTLDLNTWEYGPAAFPNSMSIRAFLSDPWTKYSWTSTGHYTNANGFRENVACQFDSGEFFQQASVEINGASMAIEYSGATKTSCNTVNKR